MDRQPRGMITREISQDDFDELGMTKAIDQGLAIVRSAMITEYGINRGNLDFKIMAIPKPTGRVTDSGGKEITTRGDGDVG